MARVPLVREVVEVPEVSEGYERRHMPGPAPMEDVEETVQSLRLLALE